METKKVERVYRLKAMVLARLLAEVTVLLILVLLPPTLLLLNRFAELPYYVKMILPVLSIIALCVLPGYGFVTCSVRVNEEGIATRALFKRQFACWDNIRTLALKTSFGWRRYTLSGQGVDMTFPVWLNEVRQLTEFIRARLPGGGRTAGGGERTYHQDIFSLLVQFLRLCANLVFIVIFWMFFRSLSAPGAAAGGKGHLDPLDTWLILSACIVFTLIMVLRCVMIALMPRALTVGPDGIELRGLFFKRQFCWRDVKELSPPSFILPEGYLLKTRGGWFLLGESLELFDELQDELMRRLTSSGAGG